MSMGDFALGTTIYKSFTTVTTTGAPTQLAGTPVLSVYENGGTTEITAGVSLTVDLDARTGLNLATIVATSGNGFEVGKFYDIVITTGTVGGTSVVGYVVASFSLEAGSALRPTVAGRTFDVSAGGEGGVDWANVGTPNSAVNLSGTSVGTAAAVTALDPGAIAATSFAAGAINAAAIAADAIGASELAADAVAEIADAVWDEARSGHTTDGSFGQVNQAVRSGMAQGGGTNTITLDASASAVDDIYRGGLAWIVAGTGKDQSGVVTAYVGATKVATVDNNWRTNPDATSVFVLLPGSLGLTSATLASAVWGAARASYTTAGTFGEGVLLASAAVQAIWDALTSALTTVGSIGKRLVDYLTGDIYARLGAPAGASTAADIAAVKADTAAVKTKTDFLPSATAGAAGGVFIAGTNAATTVNVTGNITGNLSGSVGSVTGAVGSVTGAVGSVTGNVGGNVVGSVASVTGNVGGNLLGTLSTTERDAIAAALLDLAAGVETGLTLRQALRLVTATTGGKLSGGGTATEVFRNAVADSKARVTATVDASGNRSAITYDLT